MNNNTFTVDTLNTLSQSVSALIDGNQQQLPAADYLRQTLADHLPADNYFFTWQLGPTVVMGRNQVLHQEVDVDFCRREKAKVVIRGVRVYSDFEYEFQMALTNRRMAPEIETLFMMPSENLAYVTASTVREIAAYGGDTAPFVTAAVQKHLKGGK